MNEFGSVPIPPRSNPYIDDEREALIDDLNATVDWLKRTRNYMDADRVMRAIAALRRQGPIPDEWEYEVTYSGYRNPTTDGFRVRSSYGMLPTLEAAQEWAAKVPNPTIRRRTKAVEAGPWEPVEAAERAR